MIEETTKAEDAPAPREPAKTPSKFPDGHDGRVIALGKLQTDEEARLAAEIEKLRD